MERVVVNLKTGRARSEEIGGREYLVAPVTALVPGVLAGSAGPLYYPPEEVRRNVDAWNGMPLLIDHPTDGAFSGRNPTVLKRQGVGNLYNVAVRREDGALVGEAWFDVDLLRRTAPGVLGRLRNGERVEVSTGLYTVNEPAPAGAVDSKGRPYSAVARAYRPDHLAVLPTSVGACSVTDGCGVFNASGLVLNPRGNWTPPESGDAPEGVKKILRTVYAKFRDKNPAEKASTKAKGAKIAWGAVRRAGWRKVKGKWKKVKNEGAVSFFPERGRTMGLSAVQREEYINYLTTNCDCWKGEGDRETLSAFPDEKLVALRKAAENTTAAFAIANKALKGLSDGNGGVIRVDPETGEWKRVRVNNSPDSTGGMPKKKKKKMMMDPDEEYEDEEAAPPKKKKVANAPPAVPPPVRKARTLEDLLTLADPGLRDSIESTLRNSARIEEEAKEKLIGELLANQAEADRPTHREWLVTQPLENLRRMATMIPKAPPAPKKAKRTRAVENEEDDFLALPTMRFGKEEEEDEDEAPRRNRKAPRVEEDEDEGGSEDVLNSLPAHMRAEFEEGRALRVAEKRRLIESIVAGAESDEAGERLSKRLENKSIDELKDLVSVMPRRDSVRPAVSFFGPVGGAKPAVSLNGAGAGDDDDVLTIPKMSDFDDDGNERPKRRAR